MARGRSKMAKPKRSKAKPMQFGYGLSHPDSNAVSGSALSLPTPTEQPVTDFSRRRR